MIRYKIPPLTESNLSDSFLLVKRKNHKHTINNTIHLSDYSNTYLGTYFIITSNTIKLKDIDNSSAYLHLNVSKEKYIEIMQYRGYKLNENVDILILSDKHFGYYD